MNKNINNVSHGNVAKASGETQAMPEGLILELSGELVNKRDQKCFRGGAHVKREGGEDSLMSLTEIVVWSTPADLNCKKLCGEVHSM